MILRGLASLVVVGLFVLNLMMPTSQMGQRGAENLIREDVETHLVIGQALPELSLFDLYGRRYSREDLLGHRVLITFERSVDW
jgi:hypothetical protein